MAKTGVPGARPPLDPPAPLQSFASLFLEGSMQTQASLLLIPRQGTKPKAEERGDPTLQAESAI